MPSMAGDALIPDVASQRRLSSPSDILGDNRIRPSLVKVPRTQKQLLSKYQSWAGYLAGSGRRPNAFVNVPPEVLDQFKAWYMRQSQETDLLENIKSENYLENDVGQPKAAASQPTSAARSRPDNDDEGDRDNEDTAEPIPWSSSPEVPFKHPQIRNEEASQAEESEPFLTQISEKSPSPLPASKVLAAAHLTLPSSGQSSQEAEEELEVEIPAALGYNPTPINKSALPVMGTPTPVNKSALPALETPSSAQVVPCTLEQSFENTSINISRGSAPEAKRQPGRYVYNRVPELYRGPKHNTSVSHSKTPNSAIHIAPIRVQQTRTESALPPDIASSPIIPSTRVNQAQQAESLPGFRGVSTGQMPTRNAYPNSGNQYTPAHTSPLPHIMPPSQSPVPAIQNATPSSMGSRSWGAPFIHYAQTYPSYNGTIQDFVGACMYIQIQHRRIRTSLYDDFIRAWVDGYMPYVMSCDEAEPPQKPLRAIEWYNDIDDDPFFTSRVVTRQNIQDILNFYPQEVAAARASLGLASNEPVKERPTSLTDVKLHVHENLSSPIPTQVRHPKAQQLLHNFSGIETRAPRLSQAPSVTQTPHSREQHQTQKHQSASRDDSYIMEQNDSTSTISNPNAYHKMRASTIKSRSEIPKGVSAGPTQKSSNRTPFDPGKPASSRSDLVNDPIQSSAMPEPSARRRSSAKAVEDPEEKRRRRLAKHIRRRLAEKESFSSSAPIGSTPAPG